MDVQATVPERQRTRSVISRNFSRTASRLPKLFLRPKSLRLLEQSSLRRKVENFSYCLRRRCGSRRGRLSAKCSIQGW